MGLLGYKENEVSSPAANQYHLFFDSTEARLKVKDEKGVVSKIGDTGIGQINMAINGGFSISQRLTAALTTIPGLSATAKTYFADRWAIVSQTISATQYQQVDARSTPETGLIAPYYARLKQITGAGKIFVMQAITGVDSAPMKGKDVRLQFKMKTSVGATRTMRFGLFELAAAGTLDTLPATMISAFNANAIDPTLGTSCAYVTPNNLVTPENGTIAGNAISCTLTSGANWVRYGGVFTVPADCKNICIAIWSDSQLSINDDVLLTEVILYNGKELLDYEPQPNDIELRRCQHYYSKSFLQGSATPAGNLGVAGSRCGIIGKAGATALAVHIPILFPVTMFKTAPTIVTWAPSTAANANPNRIDGTTPAVQTAVATIQTSDKGCVITATGDAAGAVGDLVGVHYTADAEI